MDFDGTQVTQVIQVMQFESCESANSQQIQIRARLRAKSGAANTSKCPMNPSLKIDLQSAALPDPRETLGQYLYRNAEPYRRTPAPGSRRAASYVPPPDEWKTPMFAFCRAAKAHPQLREHSAEDAIERVHEALLELLEHSFEKFGGEWHDPLADDGSQGVLVRTFQAYHLTEEDLRVEFFTMWERIRYAEGETPLYRALEMARHYPYHPRRQLTDGYDLFISMAAWLQIHAGKESIFLPCRLMASYLGCAPITVSRYRELALRSGLLRETRASEFHRGGQSVATEFVFALERFDRETRREK
jgi:hypothetical protein